MTRPEPQRYVLVLRAETGNWWFSPEHRLRAALKALGRRYGLRVVSLRPLPGKEASSPTDAPLSSP